MTFVRLKACHTHTKTGAAIVMGDAPGHHRPVAELRSFGDPTEANRYADLFAAAPKLLAAAKQALDELEVWQMSAPEDEDTAAAVTALREAIAQAG